MLKQSIDLAPDRQERYKAKLVFYLFLASLGMFFIGSMVTYLIVRYQAANPNPGAVPDSNSISGPIVYQSLRIPVSFWVSTIVLVSVSLFLERACWLIRRENRPDFRRWLTWAMVAASLFVVIQCIGMSNLLGQHFSQTDGSTKVYGMSFTLALIHALHVVGGMIFLGFIIFQSARNRYDHERHWAVDHCASYWHFLDVVWACMLITFLVTH